METAKCIETYYIDICIENLESLMENQTKIQIACMYAQAMEFHIFKHFTQKCKDMPSFPFNLRINVWETVP